MDSALTLAESSAIVEYIIYKHSDGTSCPSPGHPDYADYLYLFHFSNARIQATIGRNMMTGLRSYP
jgi:glutathione S-transferase